MNGLTDVAVLQALVAVGGFVIILLLGILGWFIRKDRNKFLDAIGKHEERIGTLEGKVEGAELALYGPKGRQGLVDIETRFGNLLQAFGGRLEVQLKDMGDSLTIQVTTLRAEIETMRLAFARAVPNIRLEDIRPKQ